MAGPGEKQFMAALDNDDNCGGKPGEMELTTYRAFFSPFCSFCS
jgi:hypothetical protein